MRIISLLSSNYHIIKKGLLPGRTGLHFHASGMHTQNALSLRDRVMVMQDDEILVHALTKVAIIPGIARIFVIFLIIGLRGQGKVGSGKRLSFIAKQY